MNDGPLVTGHCRGKLPAVAAHPILPEYATATLVRSRDPKALEPLTIVILTVTTNSTHIAMFW